LLRHRWVFLVLFYPVDQVTPNMLSLVLFEVLLN
jgi:hypothetical protein